MKKLHITALFLAAVLTLSGCSSKNSSSSNDSAAKISTSSASTVENSALHTTDIGETDTFNMRSFRYKFTSSYTKTDISDQEIMFKSPDGDIMLYIEENPGLSMTAAALAEDLVKDYEKHGIKCKWSKLEGTPFDTAVIDYTEIPEDDFENFRDYTNLRSYFVCEDAYRFTVYAFSKNDKGSEAESFAETLLSSLEFTGERKYPDSAQTVENDFAKITFQPKWYDSSKNIASDEPKTSQSITLKYTNADSANASFSRFDLTGYYDSGAEDYIKLAEQNYEKAVDAEGKMRSDTKLEDSEILGFPAKLLSFVITMNDGDIVMKSCQYYFQVGLAQYRISYSIPLNDTTGVMDDINDIIANIEYKDVSPEMLDSQRNAVTDSRFPQYTYQNATFRVPAEIGFEESGNDGEMIFNGSGIEVVVSTEDIQDAPSVTYYRDVIHSQLVESQKGAYCEKENIDTPSGNEFKAIAYAIDNYDIMANDIVKLCFAWDGEKVWRIKMTYSLDDKEFAEESLSSILDSFSFSE